ncbi:MAG: hypothetical protein Q8P26_00440 [Candidatus Levybacteria bacterium]|nr:hypothetical protein [Candidatus Levybacteria bacterium]
MISYPNKAIYVPKEYCRYRKIKIFTKFTQIKSQESRSSPGIKPE